MLQAAGSWRTRFAPAPTGLLHLGHIVNAIHVWGIARAFGGTVALRIEDHDRTRSRPEYERALLDDLEWLGLHADLGSVGELARGPSSFRQSDNDVRYAEAMARLANGHHVYPCLCTRRDIAAIVGHRENEEMRYPGTCRHANVPQEETLARRLQMDAGVEHFDDLYIGPIEQVPSLQCGDLLLRDRHGLWTYQFAVVVDDIAHDIDVVIRGADLIESTGRQLRLARLLGRTAPPLFLHHPLVRHADGAKLSKSSRDTGIRELREQGRTPAQLFGQAAHASGLAASDAPLTLDDIATLFAAR